ncbi:Mitochondrial distribution and morphology protein 31, mitochondrial precursor [Myotisia sp. PD_48]|nr:Mitochondrial distribution and morphology protein 31, mitochondrial precursor [Myotisia sp. PD_48]
MSGHIGRRLFSTLRTSIDSQFILFERQNLVHSFSKFYNPTSPSRGLFKRASVRNFSLPYPKNARQISRRFASGGLLVLGASPTSTATVESGAACAASVEKVVRHGRGSYATRLGMQSASCWAWSRGIHTSKGTESGGNHQKGVTDGHPKHSVEPDEPHPRTAKPEHNPLSSKPQTSDKTHGQLPFHYSHHLRDRLPHMHRPTKEELLAAATGFWSRLKVRFKWFSIRSVRPFTMDEIGAMISWVFLGHLIWIILGTTTFFSLVILAINTVFAQETLAGWVGNYLTKSSGVKVVFESAIVPKWGDGVITFKNVFVSRRPGQGMGNVTKGSSKTAAEAAALKGISPDPSSALHENGEVEEEEDSNFTQFDVSINTVNVTLSFTKWFNGRGLLKDVYMKGIRGVVDRTHVYWPDEDIDPKSYRHPHNPGDFELDSFKMEDLLVTVYQPNHFRPFPVSIFSCDLPQLRKQWLFYDFLSANMVSGSFDNSLFTIHPRQTHHYTGASLSDGVEENGNQTPWKKHNRIRIDALNIDHLNRGVQGPFSWIHEGDVDIVADVMFPAESDESLGKVMFDFYDRLEATVTSNRYQPVTDGGAATSQNGLVTSSSSTTTMLSSSSSEDDKRFVVTDLRIHLTNVRAVVPLFTRDLSYINNALIRPIVAYINSRRTFIPIQCRLVKRASDFDGSWTVFDSGLMDDLSAETYEAFARDVVDDQARMRRFKKVGLWSLQLAAQAIFMGMAANIA